jgi:flagellar protein FlgJ
MSDQLSASSVLAAQTFAAGSIPKPTNSTDAANSAKTAEEFESFFMTQMLEHMFKGIETGGYFGGGHGEDIYQSMMLKEYGRVLAKAGGLGIADIVNQELINMQEATE